jgi:hypothetical protein
LGGFGGIEAQVGEVLRAGADSDGFAVAVPHQNVRVCDDGGMAGRRRGRAAGAGVAAAAAGRCGMSTPTTADWLDRLWEHPDLAPDPIVPPTRTAGPACSGVDPRTFYPPASPASGPPWAGEEEALAICGRCPVRSWCLSQEMAECSTATQVVGVRGGLRQIDRQALHRALHGKPARKGAAQ